MEPRYLHFQATYFPPVFNIDYFGASSSKLVYQALRCRPDLYQRNPKPPRMVKLNPAYSGLIADTIHYSLTEVPCRSRYTRKRARLHLKSRVYTFRQTELQISALYEKTRPERPPQISREPWSLVLKAAPYGPSSDIVPMDHLSPNLHTSISSAIQAMGPTLSLAGHPKFMAKVKRCQVYQSTSRIKLKVG